jgi:hypothetical protein
MPPSRQSVTHNGNPTSSSKKKSMASLLSGMSVANFGQSVANLESMAAADGTVDKHLLRDKKFSANNVFFQLI